MPLLLCPLHARVPGTASPQDSSSKIYFKQNAAWLLEQELKRLKPGTEIALGTATDPYQPLERKLGIHALAA